MKARAHEYTAAVSFGDDIGGGGCDTCACANNGPLGRVIRQQDAKYRVDSGFFRPLAASRARIWPPALGSRPGAKQDAAALRREQLRPGGRRLHQSDSEARGSGDSQEVRRNLAVRPDFSGPGQPVSAEPRALYFLEFQ